MKARALGWLMLLICFVSSKLIGQSGPRSDPSSDGNFGRLPFIFEANKGQSDKTTQFVARGADYTILLKADKTEIVLPPPRHGSGMNKTDSPSIVTIEFVGGNRQAKFEAGQPLP